MKTRLLSLVIAAGIAVSACSSQSDSPQVADGSLDAMPTVVPTPAGSVLGQGMVIESPDGPILCMGAVAESYPPQCGVGPGTVKLVGWKWRGVREYVDSGSDLKFGSFAVTGTLSGDTLTVVGDPIPLALYDPMMMVDERPCVAPADADKILAEIKDLPGYWGANAGLMDKPCVAVDVLFDDGTLQDWADGAYGSGSVLINPALASMSS